MKTLRFLLPTGSGAATVRTWATAFLAAAVFGNIAGAQPRYRILHTFAGGPTEGADPQGTLAASGSVLYGMTRAGGTANLGTVFKCNTDGTGFTVLHAFVGGAADGAGPFDTGGPTIAGNTVFGMTYEGGGSNQGAIFKVGTDGTGFTLLHSFAGGPADGAHPRGSLTLSGTILYGVTSEGGDAGQGTVFRINTDGTGFALLHSFVGSSPYLDTPPGGSRPSGTLTLIDSVLYGLARAADYGEGEGLIVFRLNTDGTGYDRIVTFVGYITGVSLNATGSTLYGITGTSYYESACVFKVQGDGTGFTTLHTFAADRHPANTPVIDGNTLYGWGRGITFPFAYRLNLDGTGFTDVVDLPDAPSGSLIRSGDTLYGLTPGGSAWNGTIFAVVPSAPRVGVGAPWTFFAAVGTDATFTAAVTGATPLTFQWQRQAVDSSTWTDLHDDATYSGTNTATLTIHAVTSVMCGDDFRLVCRNSAGDDTTGRAPFVTYRPLTVTTAAGRIGESGATDGPANQARFARPTDVAVDAAGNVFIADTDNHIIRKLTAAGEVSTLAGQAGASGTADGAGPAARFNHPSGIAVDQDGNLYVADTDNDTVRRIAPAGVVSTVAGTAGFSGSADGAGAAARFNKPAGIVVDPAGGLFVADTLNHTIRQISSAGAVHTLAGAAGVSGSADGTGAAARFYGPQGLGIDRSGNLFVADTNNNSVRRVGIATGAVTTVAGSPGAPGHWDGRATSAQFYAPSAVAVDPSGNLYVIDTETNLVRAITPQGGVSTSAGMYVSGQSADGVGEAARFDHPTGIAIAPNGDFYIADADSNAVRLAYFPGPLAITAQPQSQTVTAGARASFSVATSGHPTPTFHWSFIGAPIAGATGSTYTLANAQAADAGNYAVTVSNSAGSVTSTAATLAVIVPAAPPPSGAGGSGGSGSSSGGGGPPSLWFLAALVVLTAARRCQGRLRG